MTRLRRYVLRIVPLLGCAFSVSVAAGAGVQKFLADDPLLVDDALVDVPEEPAEIELSDLYDRFGHIFKDWGASPIGTEAANVNTMDEVPDSTWFTNRHAKRRMSIAELVRGPNRGLEPDGDDPWRVFSSKSQGVTPGFQIIDPNGVRYVIKLDPVDVPEIASAAELVSTKIFYALGYNVPENYIVRYPPESFTIAPGTMVEDRFGDETLLTRRSFRRMLSGVPKLLDGTMRVVASKYIDGVPIGPFRYYGTRSDDPNDVTRHEDRRELRGLRLIAAWVNHDDTRAHNTQDSWVEEDGRHYVRHYLIDFGSTFGSGSIDMQYAHLGFHYWLDTTSMKRAARSFGFHVPKYRRAKWPKFPEHQAVGRWESELFDPVEWRNDYQNPAFLRMTARDAFWAAKLIMSFTADELAAIVETAEFSRPENTSYFLEVLIERQRKCGRFGLNVINPVDSFTITEGALTFENLSEKHGFVEQPSTYRITWFTFDNDDDSARAFRVGGLSDESEPRSRLPQAPPGSFLMAEVRTQNPEMPHWELPVKVFLRPTPSGYRVVGIERESPPQATFPMR